jgi:iron complex outermembrane recepter protein
MEVPNMKITSTRGLMLATTIISGMAFAAPAFAQTTPAAAPAEEVVVVTGTRVRRPDLVSNSPVTSISAAELEKSNVSNVETALRQMPQFLSGATQFSNNTDGPEGVATLNLRGLDAKRTLVLMDGKRLPSFDSTGVADVNAVPTALIERIDVVTGGASAVYGSDALAGVVNFTLKKNFEGLEATASASEYGEGDGRSTNLSVTMGSNFADDRGNAVIAFSSSTREAVLQGARDYSFFNIDPSFDKDLPGILNPGRRGGSSNAAATRIPLPVLAGPREDEDSPRQGSRINANRYFTPAGGLVSSSNLPKNAAGATNASFNYNPQNFFQVPQERYQATAMMSYQLNDSIEAYARAIAVTSKVDVQLATSAYFAGSTIDNNFYINIDNPFFTAEQAAAVRAAYTVQTTVFEAQDPENLDIPAIVKTPGKVYDPSAPAGSQVLFVPGMRRRMVELGNREGNNDTQTFQGVLGLRGDLADSGWEFDISGQFGRVTFAAGTQNDVHIKRAQQALIAISENGVIKCLDATGGCAPINLFSGGGAPDPSTGLPASGAVSKAAADYIRTGYFSQSTTDQQIVNATINGDLGDFKSPMSENQITVALGTEYRRDAYVFLPDDLTALAGAMGQGGDSPASRGAISVYEIFGEVYVPLIENKAFAKQLGFEGGYRVTNSSESGQYTAWKAGLEWEPVDGFRFRAMAQKAVRAPNLDELYGPLVSGLIEISSDPCAGTAPVSNATLRAKCLAQGATLAQIGSIEDPAAQQAANVTGGAIASGVKLIPETSDTLTVGLVFTPSFLPGLTGSIDYYDVKIEDAISEFTAQSIVDNCFTKNITSFCGFIKRNAALGTLEGKTNGILQPPANLASIATRGIDYNVNYRFDLGPAKVNVGIVGNYTIKFDQQDSIEAAVDTCAGEYGATCGEPIPEQRFTASASATLGDFDFGLAWRHIGALKADAKDAYEVQSIKAYNYLDLQASWSVTSFATLNASVTNVLDKDPPVTGNIAAANTSANTYVGTYDPLGQFISVGVKLTF